MNNSYKVSILVPVYNAEKYIERCARSLFEQTYDNIEFVFVNDCTPDKSINLLISILDDYPHRKFQTRIINHDKNKGVAAARNTLLNNATGDYILWVDADDYIEKFAIERLIKKLSKRDIDILCFKSVECLHNRMKPYSWENENNLSDFVSLIQKRKANTALWGRLIKRSLFTDNKIFFIEGVNIGEDLIVLLKLLFFAKTISACDDFLYYRDFTNENSIVHTPCTPRKLKMQIDTTNYIQHFFSDKIDISEFVNLRNINIYILFIYKACLLGNKHSYILWKKRVNLLKNTRPTIHVLYRFFFKCDNYLINRLWAFCIWILSFCKKQILILLEK